MAAAAFFTQSGKSLEELSLQRGAAAGRWSDAAGGLQVTTGLQAAHHFK